MRTAVSFLVTYWDKSAKAPAAWPAQRQGHAALTESRVCPDAGALAACDDLLVRPTVAIVDDDSGFRSLARILLEGQGLPAPGAGAGNATTCPLGCPGPGPP
jgi:hypothetical protein